AVDEGATTATTAAPVAAAGDRNAGGSRAIASAASARTASLLRDCAWNGVACHRPESLSRGQRRHTKRRPGTTRESKALAVLRPGRSGVTIHAREWECHGPRLHVVETDEGVVAAIADERDLASIRRPARRAL